MIIDSAPETEMDYDKVAEAINEILRPLFQLSLGGPVCDYDRIFEGVESKKTYLNLQINSKLQLVDGCISDPGMPLGL